LRLIVCLHRQTVPLVSVACYSLMGLQPDAVGVKMQAVEMFTLARGG
jgi:hypothetical protein